MESYPLHWPHGWPRTPASKRVWGQFKGTPGKILDELRSEIDRLCLGTQAQNHTITSLIISSNARLRRDGMPYAEDMDNTRIEPGVAVYFKRKGKDLCFACDSYDRIWKNLRAIQRTIEALRGIERWGSAQILDRAFDGFLALPEKAQPAQWWQVLGVAHDASPAVVRQAFQIAKRSTHPDRSTGSHEAFVAVMAAWEQAIIQRPDLK